MSKKIRVLYTIPNFDTAGTGKALLNIARRLDPNVFDPMICTMHDKGRMFDEVKKSGIKYFLHPYTVSMSSKYKAFLHILRTALFFRRTKADIIHSFHYLDDYSEALAARLAGKKWIYTKKNMAWVHKNSGLGWKFRTSLASGIITLNTEMKGLFFHDLDKVALIPRGLDMNEFSCTKNRSYVHEEFGLSEGTRVIICVANLVPVKGVEYLIDGYETIRKEHPDTFLLIVGSDEGDYAAMLRRVVTEKGLENVVCFAGKRFDVNKLLASSNIYVLPSLPSGRGDAFPVSLLEGMASCLPCIASDITGIRDQLREFPSLLFAPANSESLAERLNYLLDMSDDERLQLGRILRRNAELNYTIEREARQHAEFYLEVMSGEISSYATEGRHISVIEQTIM